MCIARTVIPNLVGCMSLLQRTTKGGVAICLHISFDVSNQAWQKFFLRLKIDAFRYKEGRVILERALVQECDGIEEHPISD